MAKFVLDNVASGYNRSKINDNFVELQSQLQNKVLYRNNPTGEPNHMESDLDMNSNRIANLPSPARDNDPATKKYVDQDFLVNAQAFVDEAEAWASNPEDTVVEDGKFSSLHYSIKSSDSATASAISESNAQDSEDAAAIIKTETDQIKTDTGVIRDETADLKSDTQAILDEFENNYWGSFTSEPTTSPNGTAPDVGDLYYNTTETAMYVYDGASWDLIALSQGTTNDQVPANKEVVTNPDNTAAGVRLRMINGTLALEEI